MWIAKPIGALSPEEKKQWIGISEFKLPLSQTLRWAQAAEVMGAKSWLIFSPDEKVGGIVLELGEPGVFECINGPHLNWDSPEQTPRQIATFAMSVSKVTPDFRSLRILPRWNSADAKTSLNHVPIEPLTASEASTIILPLQNDEVLLWNHFQPRLQRTLKTAIKEKARAEWREARPDCISNFVDSMKEFSQPRGFYVPDLRWFQQILAPDQESEKVQFGLVHADFPNDDAQAEILICIFGKVAHYLFGWEKRSPDARAALSPSAWAHFMAMREAKKRGAEHYDFNGYIQDVASDDPYAGVCKFKAQWGGEVITFFQPEYFIE